MGIRLVVIVVAALASACARPPSSSPPPIESTIPLGSAELALVTHEPFPSGVPIACGGVGLDATVQGDPADPRIAWLLNRSLDGDQTRVEVAWPPGYRARFSPSLEIRDGSGRVRLREGDRVDGHCGTTKNGVILGLSFSIE